MSEGGRLFVFTDGACSGNPGPGGWGAILVSSEGRVRELGGGEPQTTNNRMELTAVIEALRALKSLPEPVAVYTDSTYVISGVTSWIKAWRRKGWTTSEGKPVLNRDLWEALEALASARHGRLSWHYVRGHAGSPGNERCDRIAVGFSKGEKPGLYRGPILEYRIPVMDIPEDTSLPKKSGEARPKKVGGFYLSCVDGKLERHAQWSECQARVHGRPHARFKKVFSEQEADEVRRSWGFGPATKG